MKKIICLLLVLLIIAGCGSSNSESTSKGISSDKVKLEYIAEPVARDLVSTDLKCLNDYFELGNVNFDKATDTIHFTIKNKIDKTMIVWVATAYANGKPLDTFTYDKMLPGVETICWEEIEKSSYNLKLEELKSFDIYAYIEEDWDEPLGYIVLKWGEDIKPEVGTDNSMQFPISYKDVNISNVYREWSSKHESYIYSFVVENISESPIEIWQDFKSQKDEEKYKKLLRTTIIPPKSKVEVQELLKTKDEKVKIKSNLKAEKVNGSFSVINLGNNSRYKIEFGE